MTHIFHASQARATVSVRPMSFVFSSDERGKRKRCAKKRKKKDRNVNEVIRSSEAKQPEWVAAQQHVTHHRARIAPQPK